LLEAGKGRVEQLRERLKAIDGAIAELPETKARLQREAEALAWRQQRQDHLRQRQSEIANITI
jgi:prefoldin subunit 5